MGRGFSNVQSAMLPYPGITEATCERLIVVDLQNQFVKPHTERLVDGIQAILPFFKKIVISQIDHDPGELLYELKKWTPAPFGSRGHASALEIEKTLQDRVLFVRKHFYSAFTPEAAEFLGARPSDPVHICGMDTDICVLQTGVELLKAGLRPVVLSKLCGSYAGEDQHRHALIQCKRFFGREQVV